MSNLTAKAKFVLSIIKSFLVFSSHVMLGNFISQKSFGCSKLLLRKKKNLKRILWLQVTKTQTKQIEPQKREYTQHHEVSS
jgi:hypothetical protein